MSLTGSCNKNEITTQKLHRCDRHHPLTHETTPWHLSYSHTSPWWQSYEPALCLPLAVITIIVIETYCYYLWPLLSAWPVGWGLLGSDCLRGETQACAFSGGQNNINANFSCSPTIKVVTSPPHPVSSKWIALSILTCMSQISMHLLGTKKLHLILGLEFFYLHYVHYLASFLWSWYMLLFCPFWWFKYKFCCIKRWRQPSFRFSFSYQNQTWHSSIIHFVLVN